ncbi:MAG: DUF4249 domain-containing protein [Flavobacteriales bacterium]|nr:DUF4249 domain-containing protein [Flavobacteriales bacterium]
MKNLKNILLLLTAATFLSSCEDVIELELENVAPRLVIEANISDQNGPYTVTLSETGDFYEDNTFPPRIGATVTIFDELGNREFLTEVSPGIYQTATLQGVKGITYTLEINSEGKNYMASSRIPNQINPIDTITTSFLEESIFQEEGYFATVSLQDVPNVKNYYRYKIFVNGKVYIFNQDVEGEDEIEDDNLYLDGDRFSDGQYLEVSFPVKLNIGDSIKVELHHINKESFDYYRTLIDAIGESGVAAPSNPISNFGKQALGNFNAYSFDSKTIRVE